MGDEVEVQKTEDGLDIVVTPLQLAALLEGETIEEQASVSNRLWGVAGALFGAIELVGGAALLLVPEPTTVTKIAGGTLAAHGVDTVGTNVYQVVTGKTRMTLTAQKASAAAELLGADESSAQKVGLAVDITVPMVAGFAGMLRAMSIRSGTMTLKASEKVGGHAIARHVGKTDAELLERLAKQRKIRAASTFKTLGEAEKAVASCLRQNKGAIQNWAKGASAGETKAFEAAMGKVVGRGILRGSQTAQNMSKVRVVLKKQIVDNKPYFILTAYPVI